MTATAEVRAETAPHYYAVPDPLDPSKISFWYQPRRGRDEGKILPWPPRRNRWGRLYTRDVPAHLTGADRKAFVSQYFEGVRDARREVNAAIADDPASAAARFARYCIACLCCGKALIEERSKMYGIGPECRAGMPAETLTRLVEQVKKVYAESELARDGVAS